MDDPNATTWENQWYGANGGDGVMLSSVLNRDLAKYEGMTLTQIGKAMGKDPRDAVIDLVDRRPRRERRHHRRSWTKTMCGRR